MPAIDRYRAHLAACVQPFLAVQERAERDEGGIQGRAGGREDVKDDLER